MTLPAQLSTGLQSFSADYVADWSYLAEFAKAADEAGIDRLVISDHVVFGENMDAYGDPANGGSRNSQLGLTDHGSTPWSSLPISLR